MFRKFSWSRKLVLSTVATCQLLTSAAPARAMWRDIKPPSFDEPGPSDPATSPAASSWDTLRPAEGYEGSRYESPAVSYEPYTPAAAAAASAPVSFSPLPDLPCDDTTDAAPRLWNTEKSLEKRLEHLHDVLRWVQEAPKDLPWRQDVLSHLWNFFEATQVRAYQENHRGDFWQHSSNSWVWEMGGVPTKHHRMSLIPFFCERLADREEPLALREGVATCLDWCRQGYKEEYDALDKEVLPYFFGILDEPAGDEAAPLKCRALHYVWGYTQPQAATYRDDEGNNREDWIYKERRQERKAEDLLVEIVRDQTCPELLRQEALNLLMGRISELRGLDLAAAVRRRLYDAKIRPLYRQILPDTAEPEALRVSLASIYGDFLHLILPRSQELPSDLRTMYEGLIQEREAPLALRTCVVGYLWEHTDITQREVPGILFLNIIEDPAEPEELKKYLISLLFGRGYLEEASQNYMRNHLIGLIKKTDVPALKVQILNLLWIQTSCNTSLSREHLVPHLEDFLQMIPKDTPCPLPLPFILRSILDPHEEKCSQALEDLGKGADSIDRAFIQRIANWRRAGGTSQQPLDLMGEPVQISEYYIVPLLVTGEMPLTLRPSWRTMLQGSYPGDQDRLAKAGLVEEQKTLEQTLGWLCEESPLNPGITLASIPLPVLMGSAVVLEDTLLRRRIESNHPVKYTL